MDKPRDLRVGIDVGGTNTDAVILDIRDRLLAKQKVPTTPDVTSGIQASLEGVLKVVPDSRVRVTHVMVGTTHATNAILQGSQLDRVAVLRIAMPVRSAIPPLVTWPASLRSRVEVGSLTVQGGHEFDKSEAGPLDEDAIRRFAQEVGARSHAIAITSMFSPVSDLHELRAEEIFREELGAEINISLSHKLGSLGLIERESATVLNAALGTVAVNVAKAIRDAVTAQGLTAETLFAQNDGTLMTVDYAERFPVLTIGSGPANSIRGAAYLSGRTEGLVIDVGGTSTDVGVLVNGFPRQSINGAKVGGVATNFRIPDLVSIALGGGSIVSGPARAIQVGPDSVGYRLQEEALVFGGSTLTMTDAAVAVGRAAIGDAGVLAGHDQALMRAAIARTDEMLADVIDRAKASRADVPLIAVGGGSILIPDRIPGISEVVRPEHFDVANAIGAAVASVSGEYEGILHHGSRKRPELLEQATARATERAIAAGADPKYVEVIEIEEVPIGYLTDTALRVRVKVVGPLPQPLGRG
jgi:N-methylhydantoinase A/oxoprolinase/acetone carboxylase beta subunit